MKTTFVNQNNENTIIKEGENHLESRKEDFLRYMNDNKVFDEGNEENPPFYEYGLSFDYVELGTFSDQQEDYFRYQLSWGGGSEEFRYYDDGTIIFVYLDWNCGVGFDVTGEDWAEFVRDMFEMDFHLERGKYDYYKELQTIDREN